MFSGSKLLVTLFLLKALLLLVLLPVIGEILPNFYQVEGFYDRYDLIAANLVAGEGYRVYPETSETMLRLPGFVYLMAGVFAVFGQNIAVFKFLNLVCTAFTTFFVYRIAHRFVDRRIAVIAGLIVIAYPGIVLAEARAGVEMLFTCLFTGFVYFLLQAVSSNRLLDFVWSGVLLGLSVIVKSTTLVMPFFVLLFLLIFYFRAFGIGRIVVQTALLTIPMVLILTPWVLRNYELTGQMVLTQTNLGTTAYQGMHVNEHIGSGVDHYLLIREATVELNGLAQDLRMPYKYDFFQHFFDPKHEVEFNAYVTSLVVSRYVDDPLLLVKNCFANALRFFFQGRNGTATAFNTALVLPFLILVVVGIFGIGITRLPFMFAVYLVGVFIASHLPILTTARYQIPIIPLLAVPAAWSLYYLVERFEPLRRLAHWSGLVSEARA